MAGVRSPLRNVPRLVQPSVVSPAHYIPPPQHTQTHTHTQPHTLTPTGIIPLLVRLSACGVAPLVRQALGLLANVAAGFPAAQQAALAAGAIGAAAAVISAAASPAAAAATTPAVAAGEGGAAGSTTIASEAPAGEEGSAGAAAPPHPTTTPAAPAHIPTAEAAERACLLLGNLAAAPGAKAAMLAAGVLPNMLVLLEGAEGVLREEREGAESSPGATAAAGDSSSAAEHTAPEKQLPGGGEEQEAQATQGTAAAPEEAQPSSTSHEHSGGVKAGALGGRHPYPPSARLIIAEAAASALGNLCLREAQVQKEVVAQGAPGLLVQLLQASGTQVGGSLEACGDDVYTGIL